MARTRGLYAKIAATTGLNYSQIRKNTMKTAIAAAKDLVKEVLGEDVAKHPGEAWFAALKMVLPTFWELVKKTYKIPSKEEVIGQVKSKFPDYAERLKRALVPATA